MTTTAVAQALPYVAWVLLTALGVGLFLFAAITRERASPTSGYLRFSAVSAALLAGLALLDDWSLPPPTDLAIVAAPPELDWLRQAGLVGFGLLCLVYYLALGGRIPALPVAALALAAAAVALGAAAFGWAPTQIDAVPLLVQLWVLSAVTGGSMAAVVLGHWYLITPKLPEAPLILQTRMLIATLMLQVLLFVLWTTLGGGPGQAAFDAFTDGPILLVIMRGAITIAFPLILCVMALRTEQTRSMESATGLLYINLAAVMAGTIGSAALYVSTGLLL